jgi:alpha-tubulin suppressor-like RCC1 family protein
MAKKIAAALESTTTTLNPQDRVAAGSNHTCMIINDRIQCWGWNIYGQLGNGNNIDNHVPTKVLDASGNPITGATKVVASGVHTCALINGGVKCWGGNYSGELGDQTFDSSSKPVSALDASSVPLSNVDDIALGDNHTCALINGGVKCWGFNGSGQLGNGTITDSITPVDVLDINDFPITNVKSITSGSSHTCAILNDNTGMCWGYNSYNQLANSSANFPMGFGNFIAKYAVPILSDDFVTPLANIESLSLGNQHSCGVVSGAAKCWGRNAFFQLGNGSGMPAVIGIQQVVGLTSGISNISAKHLHTCATVSNGVQCWGSGALGNNSSSDSNVPVSVLDETLVPISGISAIVSGDSHSCVLMSDESVKCWGSNSYGELGNDDSTSSNVAMNADSWESLNGAPIHYLRQWVDGLGNFYIPDYTNSAIRKVTAFSGFISTFAGTLGVSGSAGDNGAATSATMSAPVMVTLDVANNLYIVDPVLHSVRMVDNYSSIFTIAGTPGTMGSSGDTGLATNAKLNNPLGIAVDRSKNIYIADTGNHVIRKVDTAGIITTIVGTLGVAGSSGDSGLATAAKLIAPIGVALDSSGNLFIADSNDCTIRKVDHNTGIITTVAGVHGVCGSGVFGIGIQLATNTKLNYPTSISFDSSGNLYIVDTNNHQIQKVDLNTNSFETVVGTGVSGSTGDSGLAVNAKLNYPGSVTFTKNGDMYIGDTGNHTIRKVNHSTSIISTIAGQTGLPGATGDGGAATSAKLDLPFDYAI